jgi:hypothetical protein
MSSEQLTALDLARPNQANQGPRVPVLPAPTSDHAGANCVGKGMPKDSFKSGWYRLERLLSQSERLPS